MISYVIRRILFMVPTLFAVIAVTFMLIHAAPGGPFDREQQLTPEAETELNIHYGLNKSLTAQFTQYLGGLSHGDFGPSFRYKEYSVRDLISQGLPVSAQLGVQALLLALLFGVSIGLYAGYNKNKSSDSIFMGFAMIGIAVPNFVIAPLLALIFAVWLHWLPVSGLDAPGALVLPTISLALPQIAAIARLTRGSVIEVLQQNYIRTARAKAMPVHIIVLRHALKPSLMPIISYLGPAAANLLTGSVVIEVIFGLPGIGRYFVQGALNRDYTLVLGVVILYATLLIILNFAADLIYTWLDPRLKMA